MSLRRKVLVNKECYRRINSGHVPTRPELQPVSVSWPPVMAKNSPLKPAVSVVFDDDSQPLDIRLGINNKTQDKAVDAVPFAQSERSAVDWPGAAADFCMLLAADDLPRTPFLLNPWTTVTDAGKFLTSLRADIQRGSDGPMAYHGTLQADLLELQRFAMQTTERDQGLD